MRGNNSARLRPPWVPFQNKEESQTLFRGRFSVGPHSPVGPHRGWGGTSTRRAPPPPAAGHSGMTRRPPQTMVDGGGLGDVVNLSAMKKRNMYEIKKT